MQTNVLKYIQITEMEFQNLRFQFGILNKKVNNGDAYNW